MTSSDFICLLDYILQKYIHNILKRFRLRRPSVIDPVYHLVPMELIFETDSAVVKGSKHFIIHVRMSWQCVLKSRSMLNNLSMMCTPSSARCVSWRMSSSSCLTCLRGRCLQELSSLSQTKGYIGIRNVVCNHPESIMKWTLGRNPMVIAVINILFSRMWRCAKTKEKSYAPNAINELELGGVLYYSGYDPRGVE
ncbi:hypothetical protein J1N35_010501 [Gossypium stocksii]|uniref:Uncharacterized protein n=1 Tax=Gossypium stocksii TaxID=47602 RepID=A0A9D3W1W3_9ROSI|nr:hypothetical protein J1N35_010501 [Gossypium stocksii]